MGSIGNLGQVQAASVFSAKSMIQCVQQRVILLVPISPRTVTSRGVTLLHCHASVSQASFSPRHGSTPAQPTE